MRFLYKALSSLGGDLNFELQVAAAMGLLKQVD